MKKNILCIMVILIFLIPNKVLANYKNIEYVDVRVNVDNINEPIILKSVDGFHIIEKESKEVIYEIDTNEIKIIANWDGDIIIYSDYLEEPIELEGDLNNLIGSKINCTIALGNSTYRDYIGFIVKDNKILSINYVKLDHYLYGVLPREIPASGGIEALKAQAIVARSYLYGNIDKHRKDGYGLCNTTHCQVYGGFDSEHINTNKAVLETSGKYVDYGGKIISTPFHSNSGGYTENSKYVWGGEVAYLQATEDPYSLNSINSNWELTINARDLENKLRSSGIIIGSIKNLEVIETTKTGRVTRLKIIGSIGQSELSGEKLRSIVGTMELKSTLFTIKKHSDNISSPVYMVDGNSEKPRTINLNGAHILDGSGRYIINRQNIKTINGNNENIMLKSVFVDKLDAITFVGKGFGHGVGMSQYGALEMAKRGYSYEDIIKHYYKGVNIIKIK